MTEQSNNAPYINIYTASRTDPEILEKIFVQRESLLSDIVERVIESTRTKNKHHQLVVGSRGSGKTALVTLLVHRLKQQKVAQKKLKIAWFNEDKTSVEFLDILLNIFKSLNNRYPKDYPLDELEKTYDYNKNGAQDYLAHLLADKLKKSSNTCLIIFENLDTLFKSIGKKGQQQFRAYLQENPCFTIFATAQKLNPSLKDRKNPFFGFFHTEHLKPLDPEGASELIGKIAALNKNSDVADFLKTDTGKSRIKALHHLAGGNHRMYIVLSQFITKDSIEELVKPFMKMVDELTPYYQERIGWIPPQQRKLIELLCTTRSTMSVKNIARRLFSTNQTISSQLVDLKDIGYVKSHKRGRESLYEITEPLMRICIEVKENKNDRPIAILVDFIKSWYDNRELENRLNQDNLTQLSQFYLSAALEEIASVDFIPDQFKFNDEKIDEAVLDELHEMSLSELTKSIEAEVLPYIYLPFQLLKRAGLLYRADSLKESIADLNQLIKLTDEVREHIDIFSSAIFLRGTIYQQQDDINSALIDYTKFIGINPNGAAAIGLPIAFYKRGDIYFDQGDFDKAISDFTQVIESADSFEDYILKALLQRGLIFWDQDCFDLAITDLTRLIDWPDAQEKFVENALFVRAIIYLTILEEKDKSLYDFKALIDLESVGNTFVLRISYMSSAEIYISQNNWNEAKKSIVNGLSLQIDDDEYDKFNTAAIIQAIYENTLDISIRNDRVLEIIELFASNEVALSELEVRLIDHLGFLYKQEIKPLQDNLNSWKTAWDLAMKDKEDMSLTLRLFSVGIEFLKSESNDEQILLDLIDSEREILIQVFGLD